MKRAYRAQRIKLKVMVAQARRSEETVRMARAAALPLAAFIVVMWMQIYGLARSGDLTMAAAAPIFWSGIAFTGVATLVAYWYTKNS